MAGAAGKSPIRISQLHRRLLIDASGRADAGGTLAWLPAQPGHHVLRAVDDLGTSATRDVDVDVVQ